MTPTGNKFDMSSSSQKKPLHTNGNGPRGSHVAGPMNRSASFRDNISRNASSPKQADVTNYLQSSRVDPKAMSSEYKFNRHGDFKKLANDALAPDASPDGLKKLKAGLRESIIKGRERVKIFTEGVSSVDKCFPDIPTKQRSRPNGLSGVSKMGPPNVIDVNQHKRTRTSKVDARPNTSNGLHGEDRALPILADGWENAKMKKKRSVLKTDAVSSPSSTSSKSNDGYRDPKLGTYPRNPPDSRSRPTDTFVSRPGAASISAHSSTPKPEQESKNIRPVNKIGIREENTARGPRSGSLVVARFSTVRATASNDRELPNPVGPTNRKRPLPASSSSPPVTQWADRRPQKISRTARRTNIAPVASLDPGTENSPSSTSSEIKDKETGGTKIREKVQKVSNLVPPTKKKKLVRGGATTARFTAAVGIPKQLKLYFDRPKSKPARPHTRKPSDRKANSRQKPTTDDPAVYTPFWTQIETLFSPPSDTDISYLKQQKPDDVDSSGEIPLCQRVLSALIPEGDDNENENDDGYGSASQDETDMKSNGVLEFSGVGPFYGYGAVCSVSGYHTMSVDNRLLLELQSVGLCPEKTLNAVEKVENEIDGLISDLGKNYHEQVSRKTSVLDKLLKSTTEAKALQEKESEQDSVDKHTVLAYQKYMTAGTKLAKKEALANVKQTLEQCREFETTGKSIFTEPSFKDPRLPDNESDEPCPQLIPLGTSVPNVEIKSNESFKENIEDEEEPPLDFSHLEIPEMDILGDGFGEQSQDLSSWLNMDETMLQDEDLMGLEVPLDDLFDINMTV